MVKGLVSIVMPVYRGGEFVKSAIESVLKQTYPNIELVIIEDPSDKTIEKIVKKLKDKRVRYVLNSVRTGFVQQLNLGISLARGEFVARMDADDLCEKERISLQVKYLRDNPEIGVVGSYLQTIDLKGNFLGVRKYPLTNDEIVMVARTKSPMGHPSVMIRRSVLGKVGVYREDCGFAADYELWCRMISSGIELANLSVPLLRYRLHQSASKRKSLKDALDITIKVKNEYFRGKSGWGIVEEIRYCGEKLMQYLPAELVYDLFMFLERGWTARQKLNLQV